MLGVLAKAAKAAIVLASLHHPAAAAHHVVVKEGDTLSGIASANCHGHANDWTGIYEHSRKIVGPNPNMITAGERLKVVCRDPKYLLKLAAPAPVPSAPSSSVGSSQPASNEQAAPVAPSPAHVTVSAAGGFEACVISHESGGDPTAYNNSSGASGLFGFLLSTWDSLGLGYPGGAYTAPVSVQMQGFQIEFARSGTAPWAPYDGC